MTAAHTKVVKMRFVFTSGDFTFSLQKQLLIQPCFGDAFARSARKCPQSARVHCATRERAP
jgi:hypothetical protein